MAIPQTVGKKPGPSFPLLKNAKFCIFVKNRITAPAAMARTPSRKSPCFALKFIVLLLVFFLWSIYPHAHTVMALEELTGHNKKYLISGFKPPCSICVSLPLVSTVNIWKNRSPYSITYMLCSSYTFHGYFHFFAVSRVTTHFGTERLAAATGCFYPLFNSFAWSSSIMSMSLSDIFK